MIILEVVLGIVIAVGFYNLIHHFFVTLPNQKRQLTVKHRVDWAVRSVIRMMKSTCELGNRKLVPFHSHLLSRIWGRDIFAYEYVFKVDHLNPSIFKKDFVAALSCYDKRSWSSNGDKNHFVLADSWNYGGLLHLDLADLINSSTRDYLRDIDRM